MAAASSANQSIPVAVETFLIALPDERTCLWTSYVTTPAQEDPSDIAIAVVDAHRGELDRFVRGTSWRYEDGQLVLTFVGLVAEDCLYRPNRLPLAEISTVADTRPAELSHETVLRHGLRHMAFLLEEEGQSVENLPAGVKRALCSLRPAVAGLLSEEPV